MAAILQFLSDHQSAVAPLLIVLMMLESAPVVDFLIPGVLILPVVGAVSGTGVWPFWLAYLCVVFGAILGDVLGYWLGRSGRAEGHQGLGSRRFLGAMIVAGKLINRHGALALFFGRFALFVHPAISPAAGFLGVKLRLFLTIDPLVVSLWAGLYMGPGHIVTEAWLDESLYVIGGVSLVVIVALVVVAVRRMRAYLHQHHSE